MFPRSVGRALFETQATSVSLTNALKLYPRRKLITENVQRAQTSSDVEKLVSTVYPRGHNVRSKDVPATRHRAVVPSGQKRFLTPYELSKRVKVLCDRGEFKEAIAKLKEAPRDAQNVKVWNSLIHDVMEAGKYKEGYRLFTDMKRRGFSPTTRTYSTMLGAYTKVEDWENFSLQLDNVHSLYEQLQRHYEEVKRKDPHSTELSTIPYTQLIKILGRAQQFQRMYDVFNSMPSEGPLAPSIHTYTALLNSISNRKASSLIPSISVVRGDGEEEEPSAPSHHELMFKNSSDAKLIWRQLIQASAKSPEFAVDSHALRALLKILGRGRPSDQNFAFDIVHEYFGLAKPGQQTTPPKVELHPLTFEALLVACNNAKRYNLTLHYAQQIIDSDSSSGPGKHPLGLRRILDRQHMEIVLEAYAARASLGSQDESEDALETLEWMLRMQAVPPSPGKEGGIGPQIRPTASTYDLVALTCWRCADWKRVCRVFELMTGYDAAQFCGNMRNLPQKERRTEGRSLIPTSGFMLSFIKAASKTYQSANMQQALNIFEHYGWDTFFRLNHPEKGLSQKDQKERKDRSTSAARLANELAQVLPHLLKLPNWDTETRVKWKALQRRAESEVNTRSVQGEQGRDLSASTPKYDKGPVGIST